MAKITVSRLFEISQILATPAGQQLQGAFTYLSEFAEVTLRNLRNGLTFRDNIDCNLKTVQILTGVESIVNISTNQRAIAIIPLQAIDQSFYVISKFGWKYNNSGQPVVFASFQNTSGTAPAATTFVSLALLILFG